MYHSWISIGHQGIINIALLVSPMSPPKASLNDTIRANFLHRRSIISQNMLLAERKWILSNATLHNRMVQRITGIEIKSVRRLHNDTNKNPILSRNVFQQERGIDRWLPWVSKYPQTPIIALTCTLIHLDDEKIAK